jgi:hypothetical protein
MPELDWPDVPRRRCPGCGTRLNHQDTHTCDTKDIIE